LLALAVSTRLYALAVAYLGGLENNQFFLPTTNGRLADIIQCDIGGTFFLFRFDPDFKASTTLRRAKPSNLGERYQRFRPTHRNLGPESTPVTFPTIM